MSATKQLLERTSSDFILAALRILANAQRRKPACLPTSLHPRLRLVLPLLITACQFSSESTRARASTILHTSSSSGFPERLGNEDVEMRTLVSPAISQPPGGMPSYCSYHQENRPRRGTCAVGVFRSGRDGFRGALRRFGPPAPPRRCRRMSAGLLRGGFPAFK